MHYPMKILEDRISQVNHPLDGRHQVQLDAFIGAYQGSADLNDCIQQLIDFQVAVPSWALGTGGTRFGRFSLGGEPTSLQQKIADIGLLHKLTGSAGEVSLHIPWDIPSDIHEIKELAAALNIKFGAVNSNTFQDQPDSSLSYKYGSLCHTDAAVRDLAIRHNHEVVSIGNQLGASTLTVWLADGANIPGQKYFAHALRHTENSLKEIYTAMPDHWKLLVEYKPYEPNFYSTVIQDWGTSCLLASACGDRAFTLVDLGHHLPNTNIEQIVATLLYYGKLGGFHFNDSKYGDDDLTVGSIKPYALFLIFMELVKGMRAGYEKTTLEWMIDASHNTKDPLEDLLQSLDALMITFAKALLVDYSALEEAQQANDTVKCQEILQEAYLTDVRPLVSEARKRSGGALNPIKAYRSLQVRQELIKERGANTRATGL